MQKIFMYVSQWSHILGKPGMSLFGFDPQTGAVEKLAQLDTRRDLGCTMIDRERKILYACNETDLFPETPYNSGRVYAYAIDPKTGMLTERGFADTYCPFPSYLNTDPSGRYMVVSNHSMNVFATTVTRDAQGKIAPVVTHHDALVNLFEIRPDGTLGEMLDVSRHGAGSAPKLSLLGKPSIPHPHCVMRSPSGHIYAVCDKGDGHIYLYAIDEEKGRLRLLSRTMTNDTEESEPRYCVFHPTKPFLYVNHEHTPDNRVTVTAFRYGEDGSMEKIDTLRADTSSGIEAVNEQQGMCMSADGRFIYTQAHGCNLLLVLAVDAETGRLRQIQAVPVQSKWPRCVALSPDGRFLIQCCLDGEMRVYAVGADGTLTPTPHHAHVQGGAFVSFYAPEE